MPNDRAATVPASHLLLALAIVAVWGSNFVVIKQTLDSMPPLLFAPLPAPGMYRCLSSAGFAIHRLLSQLWRHPSTFAAQNLWREIRCER